MLKALTPGHVSRAIKFRVVWERYGVLDCGKNEAY